MGHFADGPWRDRAHHPRPEKPSGRAVIPVVYAAAMGVDALAALGSGWAYDRVGLRILLIVPFLSALVPILAFTTSAATAIAGVLVWGVILGVQESTMRAAVADLVPAGRSPPSSPSLSCRPLPWSYS
jgi:MFS family permease